MRSTINTTTNPIRDCQDRTNLAGVDVLAVHLTHRGERLHARLAGATAPACLEAQAALAGGKRALQPAFPGAMSEAKQRGSMQPQSFVVGRSYRPWRSPRATGSRAFAAIA